MTSAAPPPTVASGSSQDQGSSDAYGPAGRSDWMDVDWRKHLRRVRVEDRWMNVVDVGSGPPLLFVHALSGCWQNWLENICFFARDHRVIAVDLPGFGQSEMPSRPITIPRYARTLDALCEALGIDSAVVVGSSLGGFVGAELAIRYPQRVERLCLVAAAGLSAEHVRTERSRGLRHRIENMLFFSMARLARRTAIVTRRPRMRRLMLSVVAAHPERLPGALIAEQVRGSGKPGFPCALDAMCWYPIRDRLGEIACPTLIVWGEQDRLVPLKDAAEFERLIPDARKIIYADTGHTPMFERPARFNADLRAFIEEPAGEPGAAPVRGAVAG